MTRRQRAAMVRLAALILLLLVAMWAMWKLLLGLPPAPPPEVKVGGLPAPGLCCFRRDVAPLREMETAQGGERTCPACL